MSLSDTQLLSLAAPYKESQNKVITDKMSSFILIVNMLFDTQKYTGNMNALRVIHLSSASTRLRYK